MTREMVVKRPRSKPIALPPLIPGIERVQEMVILGVTISDGIGFGAHMDKMCCKPENACSGIRILVAHSQRLFDVVRAIVYPRTATLCLLYLAGVCHCTVGDRKRLNGILRKLTR